MFKGFDITKPFVRAQIPQPDTAVCASSDKGVARWMKQDLIYYRCDSLIATKVSLPGPFHFANESGKSETGGVCRTWAYPVLSFHTRT